MAFTDRLTNDISLRNAEYVKNFLDAQTKAHLNTLLTDLISENPDIVYHKLENVTYERIKYEMNREMRKRNWVYRTIRVFEDKYTASNAFLRLFEDADEELLEHLDVLNDLILTIQNNYFRRKYWTKKLSFVLNLLTRSLTTESRYSDLLTDMRDYFTS
jgi:hypothetical protein